MDNRYYYTGQQPSIPPPPPAPPQPAPVVDHVAYRQQKVRQEIRQAIGGAHEVLISARTVFPFVLFPDFITVDRGKLNISHRSFFKIAEVTSIRIEDILNVTANVGPLFGSLHITTRFFGSNKGYKINWLQRCDALKIKRILQGYIMALKKQIDTSALSSTEFAKLFLELGVDAPDERA